MAGRVGIAVNLPVNATEDLLLIQNSGPYPEGKVTFAIGNEPRAITGLQKVAQMFLKILMTTKGSDVVHVNMGTNFNSFSAGSNRIADDAETYSEILASVKDAESQVITMTSSGLNDDSSVLQNVNILGLDTSLDSLLLYVQIVTRAGETAAVAVPFPQLDMVISNG